MRATLLRPSVRQRLAVPAYFRPGPDWKRLTDGAAAAAGPNVGLAVLNIDSGPGDKRIPEYVFTLDAARSAGVELTGYIDTNNGARRHSELMTEMDRYRAWYGPMGFFFDRAQVDIVEVAAYLAPLHHQVKSLDSSATVILNPGVSVSRRYMDVADIIVDFEGPCDQYLSPTTSMPRWRSHYDPARFWHIVYDVPRDRLRPVVDASRAFRTGWLYATDQAIDEPQPQSYLYDRLPSLPTWKHLATLLAGARRG
jgi:Spherulation-specific family 4